MESTHLEQPLCDAVLAKLHEQIERTIHLIGLIPAEQLHWVPPIAGAWPIDKLLGHLLDCMGGICAALAAAAPDLRAHFAALRQLPVNHECSPSEAMVRIHVYRGYIDGGFALLHDADLTRAIPTVFVPRGETLLTLLLGNLEHLINHKHQLFTYLKEMGVDVGSRDLYHFRGETAGT